MAPITVKDRSMANPNLGEATGSARRVAFLSDGYGQPENAHVPGNASVEVPIVAEQPELCDAADVDMRGSVESGPSHDSGGDGHHNPDGSHNADGETKSVTKAAGVRSHPDLMRAHQLSSITAEDHDVLHNCAAPEGTSSLAKPEKCGPFQKPPVTPFDPTVSQVPVVYVNKSRGAIVTSRG
jgi:hypothetical protein